MCTQQREITNKYTGVKLYKKCGHCPACLQEKAAYRVSRIKAQDSKDLDCIMVGLTYRRYCAPYVLRDDAFKFSRGEIKSLPVYRDTMFRKVRQNASYDIDYKKVSFTHKLTEIEFINSCDFHGLHDLRHEFGKIGVSYYPDVQRFLARLRLNLNRNFNFHHEIKAYSCSEYGAGRIKGKGIFRPHFHLLFWIPKGNFEVFRSAVVSSWPFGDIQKWPRAVELAYKASSYVASYVNSGSDFPQFLKQYFKPKHSYSKDFGCNKELFSLPKILEHFKRGHLTYNCLKADKIGNPIVELPYPKYIIHRFFPKFKGYGRIADSTLCGLMQRFAGLQFGDSEHELMKFLYERPNISDLDFINRVSDPVFYTPQDAYKIGVRLRNAYVRFCSFNDSSDGFAFSDYCRLHVRIWRLYMSDILRLHMQNDDVPLYEKYDNLENIKCEIDYNGRSLPLGFTYDMFKVTDPNKFVSNIRNTDRFAQSFYENIKHRRVSNTIMSLQYEEF